MVWDWELTCSACAAGAPADGLPTVCACGAPWLVASHRSVTVAQRAALTGSSMWRYRPLLPLMPTEVPVSLGEGGTPLLPVPRLAAHLGLPGLWVKDEAANPTGSFKARGLAAAVTRAVAAGARRFTLPTAGNAGVAAAAYGARAGAEVRVFAPRTTPAPLLAQMAAFGATVVTIDGHIGDCGARSRAWGAESGAFDLSTLREPYRIEGKKTLGLEIAEQLGWRMPDVIVYPTGGGTGLIGMWKAFRELLAAGWVTGRVPRMVSVQATGCQPVVAAFDRGAERTEPWPDPWTVASGLRVPGPLGGPLVLRILRETGGAATAVADEELTRCAHVLSSLEGVDACPEGGAAVAAVPILLERGIIGRDDEVVLFNTGAGVLYGRDLK
jgi:threonine synthase